MRAAIVLAAGSSSRYGRNKLLEEIGGVPLIRMVVDAVQRSTADDVIVVLGHDAHAMRHVLRGRGLRLVENARYEEGMSGSVAAGAAALAADCQFVAVVLGDQPIESELIDRLFAHAERTRKPIAAPLYHGARRHPVIFAASMFDELRELRGHAGVRVLIDADPSRVALLELDLPVPADLDIPDDLEELERSVRARGLLPSA